MANALTLDDGERIRHSNIMPSYFHAVVDMIHDRYGEAAEIAVLRLEGSRFSHTVNEGALLRAEKLGISAQVYDFPSGTEEFSSIFDRAKGTEPREMICDCVRSRSMAEQRNSAAIRSASPDIRGLLTGGPTNKKA